MDKRSKAARIERLRAYIAAIPKRLTWTPSLIVSSTEYTAAELAQVFQDELDALLALAAADAAKKTAVVKERTIKKRNRSIHLAFEIIVRGSFADDARVLADFGLKPRKARHVAVQTKELAIEKAKATRIRRGTLGKKQRKKLKG